MKVTIETITMRQIADVKDRAIDENNKELAKCCSRAERHAHSSNFASLRRVVEAWNKWFGSECLDHWHGPPVNVPEMCDEPDRTSPCPTCGLSPGGRK